MVNQGASLPPSKWDSKKNSVADDGISLTRKQVSVQENDGEEPGNALQLYVISANIGLSQESEKHKQTCNGALKNGDGDDIASHPVGDGHVGDSKDGVRLTR